MVLDYIHNQSMYSNVDNAISAGFLQLGYLILWVHHYDYLVENHASVNGYDLYHNMH